jgi:hypothetical protein
MVQRRSSKSFAWYDGRHILSSRSSLGKNQPSIFDKIIETAAASLYGIRTEEGKKN